MNDFTKEELEIILLDMNAYIHRTTILAESPSHRTLRDKIQSMIDNYCEHQSCKHEWVSLFVIDEDKLKVLGGTGYKCLKCSKIIPDSWGRNDN